MREGLRENNNLNADWAKNGRIITVRVRVSSVTGGISQVWLQLWQISSEGLKVYNTIKYWKWLEMVKVGVTTFIVKNGEMHNGSLFGYGKDTSLAREYHLSVWDIVT